MGPKIDFMIITKCERADVKIQAEVFDREPHRQAAHGVRTAVRSHQRKHDAWLGRGVIDKNANKGAIGQSQMRPDSNRTITTTRRRLTPPLG